MTENKYVTMMRGMADTCMVFHRQFANVGYDSTAADWQAAAEAFEALVEAAQRVVAHMDALDAAVRTIAAAESTPQWKSLEELRAALKKAGVE